MSIKMVRTSARLGLVLVAIVLAASLPRLARAQSGVDGELPIQHPKPSRQASEPTDSPATQIRIQSTLVTTPVTVIGHSGDFVSDLDEQSFKLFDNGVQQRIERFEISSDPVALVILVETNDSVSSLLGQVRPLGPVFSDLVLGPNGQAALMTFSDRVDLVRDFTGDRDVLKAALENLRAFGAKDRMNDTIMQGLALLEARPKTERRLMVVISDGADKGSENDRADVVRRAMNDEVTIYGLHLSRVEALLRDKPDNGQPMDPLDANVTRPLPPGTLPTSTNSANVWGTPIPGIPIGDALDSAISSQFVKNPLAAYAGYTGGVYYSHWSETTLQDQLNRIGSEVHTQYEISYRPSTLDQTGFHRIEVRLAKPGLRVRARAGYFYGKRQPSS